LKKLIGKFACQDSHAGCFRVGVQNIEPLQDDRMHGEYVDMDDNEKDD